MDMQMGPTGGSGNVAPGILRKKKANAEEGEEEEEETEEERLEREYQEKLERRRYKKMRKILKKKKQRLLEQGLKEEADAIIVPPKWGKEEGEEEEEGGKIEDRDFKDKFVYDKSQRRGGKQNIMYGDEEQEAEERMDRIETDLMVMQRKDEVRGPNPIPLPPSVTPPLLTPHTSPFLQVANSSYEAYHPDKQVLSAQALSRQDSDASALGLDPIRE
jgi:hypothetical protein